MSFGEVGILLAVAGIVGGIARGLLGRSGVGFVASMAAGFIGSIAGVWLARNFGLPLVFRFGAGGSFPIVWAILGAALSIGIMNMVMSRPRA